MTDAIPRWVDTHPVGDLETTVVLLKVYAKCVDGQRDELNSKIDIALAGS